MPDNHFENRAKQKLNELKFSPRDAVWLNVQAQIKKDKNRRKRLLWIPLSLLLLGGGAWFLLNTLNTGSQSTAHRKISLVPTQAKTKINIPSAQPGTLKDKTAISGQRHTAGAGRPHQGMNQTQTNKNALSPDESKKTATTPSVYGTENKRNGTGENEQNPSPAELPEVKEPASGDPARRENSKTTLNNPAASATKPLLASDILTAKNPAVAKTTDEDSSKTAPIKKTELHKKNKIQWGLTAGSGWSSQSPHYTGGNALYAAAAAGPGAGSSFSPPSEKQSLSYYFGLHLEKSLNKTTQLFTGLQYRYAAVKIARGNQVNVPLSVNAANATLSYISSYYPVSGTDNYNYTNRYHFIEIPLGIGKQFGQKSRFSVNAGILAEWLVSTNALQYDPQERIYFKNNSYFSKTQWQVLAGVQYRLMKTGPFTLKIGPHLQYGVTSLLNKKSPYSEHPFFGGLQLLLIRNTK